MWWNSFWYFEELLKNPYPVTEMPAGKIVGFAWGTWLTILINKTDGTVYRLYQRPEADIPPDCFDSFDGFLTRYVFDDKYAEIVLMLLRRMVSTIKET